jgi:hypothetical protein
MTRRSGVTLVEVLVAIFVMAIGLIALLTLFPLGVLRMYQALRDERCSECAYNADKIGIMFNVRNDRDVVTDIPTGGVIADFFANPLPGPGGLPNADPYGESYPVLVDPIGYFASPAAGNGRDWVGGAKGFLRRRPVVFTATKDINRWFTLWDDISFESTNTDPLVPPGTAQRSGTAVLRNTRYSWAYLLQRPQTSDRSVVNCSIVVFDQRSLSPTGTLQLEEYVYDKAAYFNPTNGTIAIDYTANVPPPVRVGDWILDSSVYQPKPTTGSAHAYFYRVTATEEFVKGVTTYARYEVQNPIRGYADLPAVADPFDGSPANLGTVVVIRGIAEVFEKGPVRLP